MLHYICQVIWVSKKKSKYQYQRDHLVGQSTNDDGAGDVDSDDDVVDEDDDDGDDQNDNDYNSSPILIGSDRIQKKGILLMLEMVILVAIMMMRMAYFVNEPHLDGKEAPVLAKRVGRVQQLAQALTSYLGIILIFYRIFSQKEMVNLVLTVLMLDTWSSGPGTKRSRT